MNVFTCLCFVQTSSCAKEVKQDCPSSADLCEYLFTCTQTLCVVFSLLLCSDTIKYIIQYIFYKPPETTFTPNLRRKRIT